MIYNCGEAHHFKGLHNDIGDPAKWKVCSVVSTQKLLIKDAHHFVISQYSEQARKMFTNLISLKLILVHFS